MRMDNQQFWRADWLVHLATLAHVLLPIIKRLPDRQYTIFLVAGEFLPVSAQKGSTLILARSSILVRFVRSRACISFPLLMRLESMELKATTSTRLQSKYLRLS